MKKDIYPFLRLYAVTDRSFLNGRDFFSVLEDALLSGVTLVQLREKELKFDEFLKEAREVKKLCDKYSVPLIINDDVDVAKESGASGVHIGQSDAALSCARNILGKDAIIGVSVHDVKQALEAERGGADYLGLGAVFSTNTKKDVNVMSANVLKNITNSVELPMCAIGGINRDNIEKLGSSGIDGVAVVSAIFAAQDVKKSTKELLQLSEKLFSNKGL